MQNDELKQAHEFTTEVWRFFLRFAKVGPDNTNDAYWKAVITEAEALTKKYGDRGSRKKIVLDVIEALEELANGNKEY